MTKNLFVLIDSHALVHRGFHAIPNLTTSDGTPVNGAYGFTMTLLGAIKELDPKYIAATFDLPKPTFRHIKYEKYKAHRQETPDDLIQQFPIVKEIVRSLNIPIYEQEGLEADDVIGILAHKIIKQNIPVMIVTGDMDALQLVKPQIKVFTLRRGLKDTVIYNEKAVKQRYGFAPKYLIDYKALRGDPSDNIPGVKGIGEKTATDLIKHFKTIDKLYNFIELHPNNSEIKPGILKKLVADKDSAYLSKMLATILIDDGIDDFDINKCVVKDYNQNETIKLFQKYEFRSLIDRLPEPESTPNSNLFANLTDEKQKTSTGGPPLPNKKYETIDTIAKLKKILPKLSQEFTFDTETSGLELFDDTKLVGISISIAPDQGYYLPLAHNSDETQLPPEAIELLKPIFENPKIHKSGHNLKFDIQALMLAGINTQGLEFDTMLASYLLNPNSSNTHNLDHLALTILKHQMIPITNLIGEKKSQQISFADVSIKDATPYACEDADITRQLMKQLRRDLKTQKLDNILKNIELPLVDVLTHIERTGFLLNPDYFTKFNKKITTEITQLIIEIHNQAGQDFNIASTQQLSNILFDKLNLPRDGIKKTKSAFSTAASELEKLQHAHAIIPLIQQFRLLTKLKNTYVDTLPKLVKQDGRIHASFNQTITATGRLSSSNPNLQNIPVKSEIGRQIRQGFIAPPDHILIAADYSQIELRIMAHIAQEPGMIKAFKKGEDIHRATASIIYTTDYQNVTDNQRYNAKTINFSIMYGAGPRNISGQLGISYNEAKEFIDQYFIKFSHVKKYMDKAIDYTRQHGFTKTMYDRTRPVPEINSHAPQIKAAAERIAVNTPIQGTAADIMKLAMINIYQVIKKEKLNYKILSQVHDELIFEVPTTAQKEAAKFIRHHLENVCQLKVPLKVDVEIGQNWGELEKI